MARSRVHAHAPNLPTPRVRGEPMARVLQLGGRGAKMMTVAALLATALHGTAAARAAMIPLDMIHWAEGVRQSIQEKLYSAYDVDLIKMAEEKPPEPAKEAEPEKEPVKEPEKTPPPPPEPQKTEKPPPEEKEPPPPAPAAAQAGQVMAQDEVDFTGGGFAQGAATAYAGGVTHAQGTATAAVRSVAARPDGVPGGTGTAPAAPAPAVDKSRPAGLSGSTEWKCPFPPEADADQIDDALVAVKVTVGPDGRAQKVEVLKDPGHGFGREARLCAMSKSYQTAFDSAGSPIVGQTKAFNIHFER